MEEIQKGLEFLDAVASTFINSFFLGRKYLGTGFLYECFPSGVIYFDDLHDWLY